MTKQESKFAPERDSYWNVELLPATRDKLFEKGAMGAEHHRRGRIVDRRQAAIASAAAS
jgi:hypothetical protein